jgi:hypothetical protein
MEGILARPRPGDGRKTGEIVQDEVETRKMQGIEAIYEG